MQRLILKSPAWPLLPQITTGAQLITCRAHQGTRTMERRQRRRSIQLLYWAAQWGPPRTPTPPWAATHAESSTSRFSGSLKPGSRKISPNEAGSGTAGRGQRKGQKNWKECDVIEEEGLLEDEESRKGLPRRCYILAFVVGFFVLFSFFALVLWGASKPQKPKITMKSITFERFGVQAGSDSTGVSTDMMSMNATVKFTFRNTATFFGVHVTSTPLAVSYSELNIGNGDMKKFYQVRKSQRNVVVSVIGDKIPMYGSGASLSTPTGTTTLKVPLKLDFTVRSKAYVLGTLVKPKFYKKIECSIVIDPKKLNVPISLKNSCTYD
ncbi:hypothetical protein Adt_18271 [Abeliophyllum distichum]|uniref:Late embryogenesis abundant protein LEA-2 subgroup domain-containing protein n=1 Tax=Abeliophyllum distichum TaxID=126358 RepID=A0ABD1TIW6_9LAMI